MNQIIIIIIIKNENIRVTLCENAVGACTLHSQQLKKGAKVKRVNDNVHSNE